jgi:hypothetical protein
MTMPIAPTCRRSAGSARPVPQAASRAAEVLGGVLGDGCGDLLTAVEVDLDDGHHGADLDRGDSSGQLVAGGQAHVPSSA